MGKKRFSTCNYFEFCVELLGHQISEAIDFYCASFWDCCMRITQGWQQLVHEIANGCGSSERVLNHGTCTSTHVLATV